MVLCVSLDFFQLKMTLLHYLMATHTAFLRQHRTWGTRLHRVARMGDVVLTGVSSDAWLVAFGWFSAAGDRWVDSRLSTMTSQLVKA